MADTAEHKRVPRSVGNAGASSPRRPQGTANGYWPKSLISDGRVVVKVLVYPSFLVQPLSQKSEIFDSSPTRGAKAPAAQKQFDKLEFVLFWQSDCKQTRIVVY